MPISIRPALARLLIGGAALIPAATDALALSATEEAKDIAAQTTPAGNYLAGRLASSLRDVDVASVYLGAALKSDPRNTTLIEETLRLSLLDGDIDGAMNLAERLVEIEPKNRFARLALAVRAMRARQFISARQHIAQGSPANQVDVVGTLLTAWSWAGSGEIDRAIKTLDAATNGEGVDLFRDLHAGLIAEIGGNRKEARARFEAAYSADPNTFTIVDAYARHLYRTGFVEEATKAYTSFLVAQPRNAIARARLDAIAAKKPIQAFVANSRTGAAEALFNIGLFWSRQGGEDVAQVYLQLALALAPNYDLALNTLGNLFEALQKPERAVDTYARVPADSPLKRDVDIRTAIALDSMEKSDEAEKKLSEIIAVDAKDSDAIVALGDIQRRRKEFSAAAETYGRAIALLDQPDAKNWSLFFSRGVSYEAAKIWDKAEPDLTKALELAPQQPYVLNYLGYSWVDRGVNLDKGLELIRKAVELRPNDGDIVDSLGWAYYRLGRYEEAVQELERAVELKAQSWEIADHLGDAYWRVGRTLEARFQWDHARGLEPDADKLKLIEAKLKDGLPEDPNKKTETGAPAAGQPESNPATAGAAKPEVGPGSDGPADGEPKSEDSAPKAVPDSPAPDAPAPEGSGGTTPDAPKTDAN